MKRLVLSAAAAMVMLSTAWGAALGPVEAAPAQGKDACKNGGFASLGFANQGQCVKAANEAERSGQPFPPPPEEPSAT